MSFEFDPDARYRMPVMFGPTVGPRQGPNGESFDGTNAPFTVTTARFLSDEAALRRLLPVGFSVKGEPIVTFEHSILHDLAWLAGRSYSMLGVKLPVSFEGADETLQGALLTVLWENRPEPILSGREELGFNKVFCDLPEPMIVGAERICRASWDGYQFFQMRLSNLTNAEPPKPAPSDGTFHYAYCPPMGLAAPHEARIRVMLSPTPVMASKIDHYQTGTPELQINTATFEQMPTMFQIVNLLAQLPMLEMRGGTFLRGRGKSDLREQRMLRQKGQANPAGGCV